MWIDTLWIDDLRGIAAAQIALSPGLNFFFGPNAAGKTSVLEAAYLISHGRSFRTASRDALIRHGAAGFRVFSRVRRDDPPSVQRLGLERRGNEWLGRVDEQPLQRLIDLFQRCAVCCFEPGSHDLIAGGAEERRRFLDWGVFHVEPEFVRLWRRYQAALRQRNSLLKSDAPEGQLEPWELELARAGEAISRQRQTYLARLSERFAQVAADIVPGLEHPRLQFLPGWDMEADIGLAGQLAARRFRDRQRQTTTLGPHRADWRPAFGPDDSPATLSRGQQKLVALSAVLGQAEVYRDQRGDWPVLLFDDLASELDRRHQQGLLDRLAASGAQCLISATDASEAMQSRMAQASVFHVERGQVRPAQGGTPQLGILVSSATTP